MLDTNIVSYLLRDVASIRDRMNALSPEDRVVVSAITAAELRFGAQRRSGKLQIAVEGILRDFEVVAFDSAAATAFSQLRFNSESIGKNVQDYHFLIAAHAIAVGATLVTNDVGMTFLPGVKVERWSDTFYFPQQ